MDITSIVANIVCLIHIGRGRKALNITHNSILGMPRQIEVLVEDIGKDDNGQPTELYGTQRILTYKAFNYVNANPENPRYKLLYEVDENGKEVPGSPNLSAQHRTPLQQRSVAPVVNAGPSDREKELLAEIEKLKAGQPMATDTLKIGTPVIIAPEKKKPGPKAKRLNSVTEVSA